MSCDQTALVAPRHDRFELSWRDDFTNAAIDKSIWWNLSDGVPGTGGVGRQRGLLCTLRDGNLVIAAERPNETETDHNKCFTTGLAAGQKSQMHGKWPH